MLPIMHETQRNAMIAKRSFEKLALTLLPVLSTFDFLSTPCPLLSTGPISSPTLSCYLEWKNVQMEPICNP